MQQRYAKLLHNPVAMRINLMHLAHTFAVPFRLPVIVVAPQLIRPFSVGFAPLALIGELVFVMALLPRALVFETVRLVVLLIGTGPSTFSAGRT